ncbi:TlpA family protein disulfide reductase [Sphingobacterium sp. SRCM116780]|uniref:TlpA family protein disulfide reductase n=1 Tax=Sphingobacterium sp. SRCM116780 TaxID=2907623 RepID=UPI001F1719CF|nr:TlpA disulfide reductase family protein [Sphingobacterium sp. SRCM116780]UIR57818.1 TlpA family protein disulfide reductase [Sphingobacterium sp. SRCM116780]
MKIQFLIIIFLNVITLPSIAQKLTKITGFVPEAKDSSWTVKVSVENKNSISANRYTFFETETQNGRFSFDFEIDKASLITLHINGYRLFFPGVYQVLIEPKDSLDFRVNNIKKLGLLDIEVTGKGCEKINFTKETTKATFKIFKTDPVYSKQTIQYKFETTDRKLSVIDSVYDFFRDNVSQQAKDIIKAITYHDVLDNLFVSATRSESDSLHYLFDKYIVKKSRMNVLLKKEVVNYFPYHVLGNYILLSEFRNPVKDVGYNFFWKRSLEYANLVEKYFGENIPIKEFLLADLTVKTLKKEMLSDSTKALHDFYNMNVKGNSIFYQEVQNFYNYFSRTLVSGVPFYRFELPDTAGNLHRLDDFKGKVVVMDFWFNGCVGCAQMTKVLDSLESQVSKNEVEFISVSIDTKKRWLDGIGRFSSVNSLQLYTNEKGSDHPLLKYLKFSSYPMLVLIDKKGNFAGIPPDPRSKSKEFVEFVNSF